MFSSLPLLTQMLHFTLKSSILGVSSQNPLLDDNVQFLYTCVVLPYPNTMIITYYHLSWGNFKNIAKNLISICEQFGLWMYNSPFMKCRCYDRYLQYIQLTHAQKPRCQKTLELTQKKLNVCTVNWNHFFIMGEPHRPSFLVGI